MSLRSEILKSAAKLALTNGAEVSVEFLEQWLRSPEVSKIAIAAKLSFSVLIRRVRKMERNKLLLDIDRELVSLDLKREIDREAKLFASCLRARMM